MESLLEDLTAYKNRNGGAWAAAGCTSTKNFKAADNAIGFTSSTGSFSADIYLTGG